MSNRQNKLAEFWSELKRRKVVKIIIVYATVAFILMQLAQLFESSLSLPIWFDTVITIALIIGFPVAIIFSWIFDLSSEGIVKTQSISNQDESSSHSSEHTAKSIPGFLSEENAKENENVLFVARENELNFLENTLNKIYKGEGQFCFVTGEAGSGKTTLIKKFIDGIHKKNDDLIVLYGKCDSHTGVGNPYLPFREIISLLLLDIESKWEAGAITSDHAKKLFDFFPVATEILVNEGKNLVGSFIPKEPLVKRINDYPVKNDNISNLKNTTLDSLTSKKDIQTINQKDLFEQFYTILQQMSKKRPLLLVIDDIHWVDKGSVDLLGFLGQRIKQNRIMILGAYRPAEIALANGNGRHPFEAVLNELKRIYGNILYELDVVDGKLFIDKLLDSEPNNLNKEFRNTLHQQTKGHPLFTVELVKEMQEQALLVKDNKGHWNESNALEWNTMPVRVDAIIGERLSRLTPELKNILSHASIMGEEFIAEVVAKQSNTEIKDVIGILSSDLEKRYHLINAKGVQRINGSRLSFYQFRHVLFQKHLYNSLDGVERTFLHEETGEILEETFKSNIDEEAVQLAWHFQQAGIIKKAIYYRHKAAIQAKSIFANDDAIEHFNKVLELIESESSPTSKPENTKLKVEVLVEIGKLLELKNHNEKARNSFVKALSLLADVDIIWKTNIHKEIARTYMNQKEFEKSLEEFNKANFILGENAFEPVDEWWHEKIDNENERMWLFYWQGKVDDMLKVAEKIHKVIDKCGKPGQRARFYQAMVLLDYRRFRYRIPDKTIDYSHSSLKACLESGNTLSHTMGYFMVGFTYLWHGSLEQAEQALKKAYELASKLGDKVNQSRSLTYLIVLYRMLNNLEKVIELIPVGFDAARAAELDEYVFVTNCNLAWAELKRGNINQAIIDGEKALSWLKNHSSKYPAYLYLAWLIVLPLMSSYIKQKNTDGLIEYVRMLTHPQHHLLNGNIVEYAEKAVHEWDSRKKESAIDLMKQIVFLAEKHNYI